MNVLNLNDIIFNKRPGNLKGRSFDMPYVYYYQTSGNENVLIIHVSKEADEGMQNLNPKKFSFADKGFDSLIRRGTDPVIHLEGLKELEGSLQ